ncbi:MAG: adenylate/guanylate cyclase domain-containing protein [Acidimicrobiia bacterium]|nr:adenylate/guanylate cyclase domain-containing protein [Acidimicrobiia bacterium]
MNQSSEIEAVVRRFLAARVAVDVEAMRNLHSRSDYVRLIGSDTDEWSQGYDAAVEVWAAQGNEFLEIADTKLLRIEAFENGETGWAAVEQERTLATGQVFTFRITMVLALEDSVWKVVQLHFSIPVSDEEILNVELTRTLSDLLTSIDSGPDLLALGTAALGTATILFTDLVDSTSLSQKLGDRAWSDLIASHFQVVREIVEREGGTVVKTIGDGGMYAFASATSALAAAVGIQRAVADSTEDRLRLRVGIHTGDVIQNNDDYIGLAVNKAARVAAAAQGDQTLVSSTTMDMVNTNAYAFGDPITAELKGLEGTHILWPLQWEQTNEPGSNRSRP